MLHVQNESQQGQLPIRNKRCILKVFFSICCGLALIIILTLTSGERYFVNSEQQEEVRGLFDLGFVHQPLLYPQSFQDLKPWPVFAMAVRSAELYHLDEFIINFRKYFLQNILVVYALDLSRKEYDEVLDRCFCQVRVVKWKLYPNHVTNIQNMAYLPILMQESLIAFGSVFWCDISMRFTSNELHPDFASRALTHGLVVWPRDPYPTSTFTHPNVFEYINESVDFYQFHRMVYPIPGIYFNTRQLHRDIMLPWVTCALRKACVEPAHVLNSDYCILMQKPRYLFSGCHRFATSLFNIYLRHIFNYTYPYIGHDVLFNLTETRQDGIVKQTVVKLYSRFVRNLKFIYSKLSHRHSIR